MTTPLNETPIYTALAIKYGWVTTKHHRWFRLIDIIRGH